MSAPGHGHRGSKARDPERELAELDLVFKALAHATRRQVMLVLHFRGGQMNSREIAARFDHSWPTTTRHLRLLEEAGLVRVTRRGRERYYAVAVPRLDVVKRWMAWFGETALVEPEQTPPEES